MADAKVTLKPSEQIVQAANTIERITAGELNIGLKKPGILAQYRIVEIVGDSAKNEVYMGMVMPILWVCEIDGDPQPAPTTKRELEALIQRLGDEGVGGIMAHLAGKLEAAAGTDTVKN